MGGLPWEIHMRLFEAAKPERDTGTCRENGPYSFYRARGVTGEAAARDPQQNCPMVYGKCYFAQNKRHFTQKRYSEARFPLLYSWGRLRYRALAPVVFRGYESLFCCEAEGKWAMKKRVLSIFLSLCLLLCSLPVRAQEAEEPLPSCVEGCCLEEGHDGPCVLHEARYQAQAGGEWAYGSLSDACDGVYAGGSVELLRDIAPDSTVTIRKKLTLTSADRSAPCKITYAAEDRSDYLLTVSNAVTLADIVLDGGREEGLVSHAELVGVKGGALTMLDGAVIQNNDNIDTAEGAGGLRVISGQAVMAAGSAIRNCRGVAGGGAAVVGIGSMLGMDGGVIERCQAFLGGGVYIRDTAQGATSNPSRLILQSNSSIRDNQAKEEMEGMSYGISAARPGCGGGVYIDQGAVGLNPSACTVADNTAENSGGGIYVFSGLINLLGGTVSGNQARKFGGGILASPHTQIQMGYSPTVTGNVSGNKNFDNLYLDGRSELPGEDAPDEEQGEVDKTRPIQIGFALGKGISIGVSRWVRPDEDHPYRVVAVPANRHKISEDDLARFYSDDPNYVTLLHEDPGSPDNGTIVITHADVAFDNQGHGVRPPSQLIDQQHMVHRPDPLSERGYTFGGWYTEPECTREWQFDTDTVNTDVKPQVLYAKWDLNHYPITYKNLEDGVNEGNPEEYTVESPDITLAEPRRVGYRFLGWAEEAPEEGAALFSARLRAEDAQPNIPAGSIGPRVFVAQWAKADPCTVTYEDGVDGKAFARQEHPDCELWSATPGFEGTPARVGYTFDGWLPEVEETVTGDAVYTAQWKKKDLPPSGGPEPEEPPYVIPPALESQDHFAYIVGYPDGTVRPEAHISRAEVASIFFRLMTEEFRQLNWAEESPFSDVKQSSWYRRAVSTCTRAGLINGFMDGTFGGEKSITRAEFAAIAARFLSEEAAPDSGFSDLAGHWAKGEIDRAVAAGWIKGFPDGSFRPNAFITRAEAMTLVNRMLGRVARPEGMLEEMAVWPDNPASAWYYADVQEAANGHTYEREGEYGPETWTGLTENRDWTELER